MAAGFDRIAKIYRWGEYVSFGPLLALTRRAHVQALKDARHAVVLGDGDGRFTEYALRTHPALRVTAVDISARMLQLLARRCADFSDRLVTVQADITQDVHLRGYDAVVAHFFLDCLTDSQVDAVVAQAADATMWIVSDFEIPGGALKIPAKLLVRGLYLAFRVLTGLHTQRLPAWRESMQTHGFGQSERRTFLGGILFSEVWRRRGETAGSSGASNTR